MTLRPAPRMMKHHLPLAGSRRAPISSVARSGPLATWPALGKYEVATKDARWGNPLIRMITGFDRCGKSVCWPGKKCTTSCQPGLISTRFGSLSMSGPKVGSQQRAEASGQRTTAYLTCAKRFLTSFPVHCDLRVPCGKKSYCRVGPRNVPSWAARQRAGVEVVEPAQRIGTTVAG